MVEEINQVEATVENVAETAKPFQEGDILSAKVAKIEEKQALLDVGYKFEAILPISEVSSVHIEKISDVLNVGDEISVAVKKYNEEKEELVVSKKAVDAAKAWDVLKKRLESGEVFEATVAEVVKGGLVVDVGVRGFVPASQVERHFVEDFSDYKGRTLRLKVIELDEEKNRAILSQRAVLEEESARQKEAAIKKIKEGQIIEGTVQRLTDFGAFVDVGGVDGLVHISEMSWDHVNHPSDILKEGDRVKVKVLRVDVDNDRISLSMKATEPSPWEKALKEIKPGSVVTGVVKRLVSFGAFVEVAPGVEGLVHISQISNRHIGTPGEVLKVGEEVKAKVLDVNAAEKRISLSIKELEETPREEVPQTRYEESTGMGVTIGDVIGEELRKKLK